MARPSLELKFRSVEGHNWKGFMDQIDELLADGHIHECEFDYSEGIREIGPEVCVDDAGQVHIWSRCEYKEDPITKLTIEF